MDVFVYVDANVKNRGVDVLVLISSCYSISFFLLRYSFTAKKLLLMHPLSLEVIYYIYDAVFQFSKCVNNTRG